MKYKKGDTLLVVAKNQRGDTPCEAEFLEKKIIAGKEVLILNFDFAGQVPCIAEMYKISKN